MESEQIELRILQLRRGWVVLRTVIEKLLSELSETCGGCRANDDSIEILEPQYTSQAANNYRKWSCSAAMKVLMLRIGVERPELV